MIFEEFSEFTEVPQVKEALELPDSVRLLERPLETEAQPEAQIETREIDEGLEMDSRTREEAEIPEEAPFEYSEAYIDSQGVYHPGQITGVYRDSLENPAHREAAESLKGWQQQEKMMSCAVQVQRQIVNRLTESDVTEADMRQFGKALNLYADTRGTYLPDIGKLAELFNLERCQPENVSTSDLVVAKERGEALIVAVDHALLERPYLPKTATVDHAVEVLDFDFTDKENPRVIINDPGRMEGRGSVYPLSVFEKAACRVDLATGEHTYASVTEIHKKEGQ